MIKSGGGKIMGDRGWWQQNYGWLWAVVSGGDKIMGGRGWSHDLVMPITKTSFLFCVLICTIS